MEMEEFAENLITDLSLQMKTPAMSILTCSLLLRQNEQQSSSSGLVWAEVLSHCFNLLSEVG